MEAEQKPMMCCSGKTCFGKTASERALVEAMHPCPFIRARHGVDDFCRCCSKCERACRNDI